MKRIAFFLGITAILLLIAACGNKKGPAIKVDNFSSGKAGEVILIMDNQFWTEPDKAEIRKSLSQPQPAINQIEPLFDILEFQNRDFSSNFQRHRNIVRFDVNPDYSNNTFSIQKNVWSSPQVYIYFKGNNVDSLIRLYQKNESEILGEMYENDLKRLQNFYAREVDPNIEKKIREKFGIYISVPRQYTIAREEEDFLWLRFRTAKNDRFIMLYKTPAAELTEETLMDTRDRMTKEYIPGAVLGAYPVIARKLGFPIIERKTLGTKTGMEMRGLWESVNDKMGGPFYHFTFLDPSGQNAVSVDGFVYAPQEGKRDYLREVEAIVKSIR